MTRTTASQWIDVFIIIPTWSEFETDRLFRAYRKRPGVAANRTLHKNGLPSNAETRATQRPGKSETRRDKRHDTRHRRERRQLRARQVGTIWKECLRQNLHLI